MFIDFTSIILSRYIILNDQSSRQGCARACAPSACGIRPISLLRLSLPRLLDSNFLGTVLWT